MLIHTSSKTLKKKKKNLAIQIWLWHATGDGTQKTIFCLFWFFVNDIFLQPLTKINLYFSAHM